MAVTRLERNSVDQAAQRCDLLHGEVGVNSDAQGHRSVCLDRRQGCTFWPHSCLQHIPGSHQPGPQPCLESGRHIEIWDNA